jgi:hypothetical protein
LKEKKTEEGLQYLQNVSRDIESKIARLHAQKQPAVLPQPPVQPPPATQQQGPGGKGKGKHNKKDNSNNNLRDDNNKK